MIPGQSPRLFGFSYKQDELEEIQKLSPVPPNRDDGVTVAAGGLTGYSVPMDSGATQDAELIKRRTAMDDKEKERRAKMRAEWARYTSRWQKMYAKEKQMRTSAQGYDSDDEYAGVDVVESMEVVEKVISVEEFPA